MFCEKCGKEIQEEWRICPECGNELISKSDTKSNKSKKGKRIKKKRKKILPFIILCIIAVIYINYSEDATQEVLKKLEKFTSIYKDDMGRYLVLGEEMPWGLVYTEVNEFVVFEDDKIVECFTEGFGYNCFSEDSLSNTGFSYDLDENEARIYLDVQVEDGHLSIVNYDFDTEEYVLNIDGDKYEPSDEFLAFVESYKLPKSMKEDIDEFIEILKIYELSIEDLLKVNYESIGELYTFE